MMISAEAVTMKYRNGRGIENISLSVARGEIHVLLGSNGAGKSTLMRLLAGLAYPDSGVIRYRNQKEHTEVTDRLRTGGFLIEQPAPYDYLTAHENLMQKGRYYLNGAESVNRALKLTGLEAHSEEKAKGFSTGMKQRLGLAMALVGSPEYLILDEPSNGMDIEGRAEMHQLLLRLKDEGMAILLSTHLVHEAEQIADRITVIHDGRLLASGLKRDLLDDGESLEAWYLKRIRENVKGLEAAV